VDIECWVSAPDDVDDSILALFGLVFLSVDLLGFRLLGGDAFLSTHSGFLILGSPGLCLVGELLRPQSLSLLLVDKLHQNSFVLENVTLGLDVELVIEMSVDFLIFSVLIQQSPQDSHASHPELLNGHAGVGRSLSLSGAGVTTLSTSEGVFARASARVDRLRLLND